jgi:integrase
MFLENQFKNGVISRYTLKNKLRAARRIAQFRDHGSIDFTPEHFKHDIGSSFEIELDSYMHTILGAISTKKGIRNDLTRFFLYLTQSGCKEISQINAENVASYMRFAKDRYNSREAYSKKVYTRVKNFCGYIKETGRSNEIFGMVFCFPFQMGQRVLRPISQENLNAIMDKIDRTKDIGKRDYAIFMLIETTGVRGCDVCNLKFSNLKWKKKEICIVQKKTGRSLSLPLHDSVLAAIRDYLTNGRPDKAQCEYIFPAHKRPWGKLEGGLDSIFRKYRIMAGIEGSADIFGFHSIRRKVGSDLASSNSTAKAAADILGSKLSSIAPYTRIDSIHLKECALDFSGLPPVPEELVR